ncbi:MAG: D-glycero-beta-D-manno-heptose 1-phosphate adenylyltransferase [Lachnospiraceae bacterium]|nr:D-glycero-beta-D-manno-heptose 1-phosphate adenylyltransferase [Lachnospiraceae bacterium]
MGNLECFRSQCVLVAGDFMMDKYVSGIVERISPEASVPILLQKDTTRKMGGAGNVIHNVASLGGRVVAMGRIGTDEEGEYLRQCLREYEVDDRFVFSEGSTPVKTRLVASRHQLLRLDKEEIVRLSGQNVRMIQMGLSEVMQKVSVVVLSDYGKGFLTEEIAQMVIHAAREQGIPVLADPKGDEAKKYHGVAVLTPNRKEFHILCGMKERMTEEEIRQNAVKLCREQEISQIVLTRSGEGISVINGATGEKKDYPAAAVEVLDVTGAGDTVIAALALALAAHMDMDQSIQLANQAAGLLVSRFGSIAPTLQELENDAYDDTIISKIRMLRQSGKRIVFTNGCFDLLHAGHVSSLRKALSFGDVLVVGINSDDSVRRIKGPDRPIVPLEERRSMLEALRYVDFVIPFEEDTPIRLIEEIRPDVLVKGKDWEGKEIVGAELVRSYGGEVKLIELEPGISTTSIVERIKSVKE